MVSLDQCTLRHRPDDVGLVILNAGGLGVTNAGKAALKTIDVSIGYVFVLNLGWRIAWAFLGNRYARWSAMLPGGKGYVHALRSYVAAFLAGHPEQYVGHNPVGRLGVAVLLLLMIIQAITGLILAGTDLCIRLENGLQNGWQRLVWLRRRWHRMHPRCTTQPRTRKCALSVSRLPKCTFTAFTCCGSWL